MSDITIQWGFVETQDADGFIQKEPALGIRPARLGGRNPIYAIPLSAAYKYADAAYLMQAAFNIAEFFGMHPDEFLINRISDLILNYLPDLIRREPFTAQAGTENGEGKILINGDTVSHFGTTTTGQVLM